MFVLVHIVLTISLLLLVNILNKHVITRVTKNEYIDDEDNVIKIQGKNNILPFISQEENTDIKQFILKKVNESIYQ